MVYAIIIIYLLLTFGTSLLGRNSEAKSPEDYFLAGRKLGPVVLFFTFIATNFSAFFFLGFAGSGYRMGYAFYAMMTLGTSFAAFTFYLIGRKVWRLGKTKGYITPPELARKETGSSTVGLLYFLVMVIFTLPYLALQPIGAGILLAQLTGGAIPYFAGATLLTTVIVAYVFIGGMKSVAITDMKQGLMMFILMFAALFVISQDLGGITSANQQILASNPELFQIEAGGIFTPAKWIGWILLWITCVSMFPQLFMRFYTSKTEQALKLSTVLYALVPPLLFICPVAIGVMGHLSYPDLIGKEADNILPMMLNQHSAPWLAALIMTGALAAFMSTLDSQLLALSTLFTRDFYRKYINPKATLEKEVEVGKYLVIILAAIGLAIAYNPPASITAIAKNTFTGFSVLFPATIAILYFPRVPNWALILSIVLGEALLLSQMSSYSPLQFFQWTEPVIPVLAISGLTLLFGAMLFPYAR